MNTGEQVVRILTTPFGGVQVVLCGLSVWLGKVWGERTLAKEQQKYEQLNMRLQQNIDALGLSYKLRTKEEFVRLGKLWEKFSKLTTAFGAMTSMALEVGPSDPNERAQQDNHRIFLFRSTLSVTREYLNRMTIFIPEPIWMLMNKLTSEMSRETILFALAHNDDQTAVAAYNEYLAHLEDRVAREKQDILKMIRDHIRGYSLD